MPGTRGWTDPAHRRDRDGGGGLCRPHHVNRYCYRHSRFAPSSAPSFTAGRLRGILPMRRVCRVVAGGCSGIRARKVRAPQGRALGNTQAERSDGKWHRNHTARALYACDRSAPWQWRRLADLQGCGHDRSSAARAACGGPSCVAAEAIPRAWSRRPTLPGDRAWRTPPGSRAGPYASGGQAREPSGRGGRRAARVVCDPRSPGRWRVRVVCGGIRRRERG